MCIYYFYQLFYSITLLMCPDFVRLTIPNIQQRSSTMWKAFSIPVYADHYWMRNYNWLLNLKNDHSFNPHLKLALKWGQGNNYFNSELGFSQYTHARQWAYVQTSAHPSRAFTYCPQSQELSIYNCLSRRSFTLPSYNLVSPNMYIYIFQSNTGLIGCFWRSQVYWLEGLVCSLPRE